MAIPRKCKRLLSPVGGQTVPGSTLKFQLERPHSVSGRELDRFLANGWYRQGQGLFTTYSTISRKILMAAPWIRVESEHYQLSRNLRRLKSRNDQRLRVHIGQAMITPYREEMFQRFRKGFKGEFYESLDSALFCYQHQSGSIFDTREITFYLDEKLIGFSYFDVGADSIASILNIYDFNYAKYSLGMYAILLQLDWCRENGIRYYYPGYAMPQNPRFDYKLRIGGIDYFDQFTGTWRPWEDFQLTETPLHRYRQALVRARDAFSRAGLRWRIGCYLNHSNPCPMLIDESGAHFLSHPIFLSGDLSDDFNPMIVDYELETGQYRLTRCTLHPRPPYPDHNIMMEDIVFPVDFDVADFGVVGLITQDYLICESSDLQEIAGEIEKRSYIEWEDSV